MKKLLPLPLIMMLILSPSKAIAQEPEYDHVVYLPIVSVGEPTPYNLRAEDFALQPSDVPDYDFNSGMSGPLELSDELTQMGAVDGHRNWYVNFAFFFTGTPAVVSTAVVFRNPSGAHSYVRYVEGNAVEDPEFAGFMPVPTMGDETIAFKVVASDDPFVAYFIVMRKGNLVSAVTTSGLLSVAEYSVTLSFAQIALDRINSQIPDS